MIADARAVIQNAARDAVYRLLGPIRGFREWLDDGMPLPSSGSVGIRDRRRWREAASLQDLCDLTIGWLSGEIRTQPGYYGPVDVDDDLAPGMAAALIALNGMGFLTRDSQAGYDGRGFDDWYFAQSAAVDGFAGPETAKQLQAALAGTRFEVLVQTTRPHDVPFTQGLVVTHLEGSGYTYYGNRASAEEIADEFTGTSAAAIAAVQDSVQVMIWDPTVGENDLWAHLIALAEGAVSNAAVGESAAGQDQPGGGRAARGSSAPSCLDNRLEQGQPPAHPLYISVGGYRVPIARPGS